VSDMMYSFGYDVFRCPYF